MRRPVAIILIFALLLQTFYAISIVTFYNANRSYVAAALCENRDKPEMHCNGKCFLKKNLKQAEDESGKSKKNIEHQDVVLDMPVWPAPLPTVLQVAGEQPTTAFQKSHYAHLYLSRTFHPPGVSC